MSRHLNLLLLITCALGTSLSSPAAAFKPLTHVWVGQQVLNDLADGCSDLIGGGHCLTLVTCVNLDDEIYFPWTPEASCRRREYRVRPEVANALLRYPAAYRAGHIGPDAFPDLVVGQVTTHPGQDGGWQTDDWLSWLLQHRRDGGMELSFAYGYTGHAAGDIFAHTYVNTYAGGAFDLLDGEQTIERRHIALEDFIERYTPPIQDAQGRIIEDQELLASPNPWLARHLILNDTVNGQYRATPTSTLHLQAMFGINRALEEALKITDFPTIEWHFLDDLRKLESQAGQVLLEADALLSPIARSRQLAEAAKRVLAKHEELIGKQREVVKTAAEAYEQLSDEKEKAYRFLQSVPEEKERAKAVVRDLRDEIASVPETIAEERVQEKCEKAPDPFGVLREVCETVTETISVANKAYTRLKDEIDEAEERLTKLEERAVAARKTLQTFPVTEAERAAVRTAAQVELKRLELAKLTDEAGQKALDNASKTLRELESNRRELLEALAAIHSSIDTLMGPLGELRKLRAFLRGWLDDVHAGSGAYMQAGQQSALAVVRRDNPLEPYSEWMSCWAPAFTGVPSPISRSKCAVSRSIEELLELISKTRKQARDSFGETGGWVVDPMGKLEEEVNKVLRPALTKAGLDLVGIASEEWQAFASLLIEEFDEDRLNEVFAEDESGLDLLLFPDIADRARLDMAEEGGRFSPTEFSAAYNAVVLSKLSLLDSTELNRLAADCGWWPSSHWGESLFTNHHDFSILHRAVRSIDGDHQWNPFAPPRPRLVGSDTSSRKSRQYGRYVPDGFRLWLSRKARVLVFHGIFRGPLNPGILDALPADYPYRPSDSNPFPVIKPDAGVN